MKLFNINYLLFKRKYDKNRLEVDRLYRDIEKNRKGRYSIIEIF